MDLLDRSSHPAHHPSSWGTLIGLFLILAVMVLGAYFALSTRISTSHSTPTALSASY